jgi:hypothetical protein
MLHHKWRRQCFEHIQPWQINNWGIANNFILTVGTVTMRDAKDGWLRGKIYCLCS